MIIISDANEVKEASLENNNDTTRSAEACGEQLDASSQSRPSKTPWYFKLSWLLFNINISIAPLVTVVYWSLLHDFSDSAGRDPLGFGTNVNIHAINSVLMILDLFVSAYPVRIVHCVYAIAYGVVYVVFSLIYWAAGGVNPYNGEPAIYPVLDWENIPGLTVAFILGFMVVLIVIQCLAYGAYRLRRHLAAKCRSRSRIADTTP